MSNFNYSRIKKTAENLISKFGAPITLVATSSVQNPEKWKAPIQSTTSVDLKAVSADYKEKYIDGSMIKRGDKKFLIAAKGVMLEPDMTGWIIDNIGSKWNIVKVSTTVPGSDKILYTVQVRQ